MSLLDDLHKKWDKNREHVSKEYARADAHTLEGLKALLTLHGGGCIAMLGFMQALLSKDKAHVFATFKFYGSNALLFFAIGLVIASLIPAARVLDINNTIGTYFNEKGHLWWDRTVYAFWALSWIAFVTALCFVGFGIQNALE